MLKLEFKINKHYLVARLLKHYSLCNEWNDLKNKLWKKFPEGFYLLSSYPELLFVDDNILQLNKGFVQAKQLFEFVLKSKGFNKIYKETENYLLWLKNQWEKNENRVIKELENITKLTLPDKQIKVCVVHPKMHNGLSVPERNIIFWGHLEKWKNYSVIYICHEIMHVLTYKKYQNDKIIHALIELAVDNELKYRLNKKDKHSKSMEEKSFLDIPEGLKREIAEMKKIKERILPFWKKYLKGHYSKNILDLEKKIAENLKI